MRGLDDVTVDLDVAHFGRRRPESPHRFPGPQEIRMQGPFVTGNFDPRVRAEEGGLDSTGVDQRDQIGQDVGVGPLDVDRQAD